MGFPVSGWVVQGSAYPFHGCRSADSHRTDPLPLDSLQEQWARLGPTAAKTRQWSVMDVMNDAAPEGEIFQEEKMTILTFPSATASVSPCKTMSFKLLVHRLGNHPLRFISLGHITQKNVYCTCTTAHPPPNSVGNPAFTQATPSVRVDRIRPSPLLRKGSHE